MSNEPLDRGNAETVATAPLGARRLDEDLPRWIGPYELVRLVGQGGMGEVWLAEQREPVRRRVALKIIKAGMDTREVVARFESERQALALMEHPAIAKVLDGGSTPEGRPFFVMEYVDGEPITAHCDRHRLSTEERLQLLVEVCEGVQHAHQKAIIHRDLKPSNILVALVDGRAQPKIIDFGIAKAISSRLTEKTLFTQAGAVIGTPEYMSPEQADSSRGDVDTRTDVYSLGVVLYLLLTGQMPYASPRAASIDELRQRIRDNDPQRPSSRVKATGAEVAEIARSRKTDGATLVRQLAGDLDAITLKTLEKDPARRYGTVSELAEDLRRHLRHEPVTARPPSATYRLRKYVRRHRLAVTLASGLAALLVAFGATMAVQARRIAVERDRANRERETAEKAATFLTKMLSTVRPELLGQALWKDLHARVAAAPGRDRDASRAAVASLDEALEGVNPTEAAVHLLDQELLDRAAGTVEKEMGGEPVLAARLELVLGDTYLNLGVLPKADQHLRRSMSLAAGALGAGSVQVIDAKVLLARASSEQGRYAEARRLMEDVVEGRKRLLGPDHPKLLAERGNLAIVLRKEGRYAEAEGIYRDTVEQFTKRFGLEYPSRLRAMTNLANVLRTTGRFVEAEKLAREVFEVRQRILGPEHPETLSAASNVGASLVELGRLSEAEEILRPTLQVQERVLGPQHLQTIGSLESLAEAALGQGRLEEAEKLVQEALDRAERAKVGDAERLGTIRRILASVVTTRGRPSEAEAHLLAAERLLHPRSVEYRRCVQQLAALYETAGGPNGKPNLAEAARWRAKLASSDRRD